MDSEYFNYSRGHRCELCSLWEHSYSDYGVCKAITFPGTRLVEIILTGDDEPNCGAELETSRNFFCGYYTWGEE